MAIEPEPELIESPLSRTMKWDGVRLDIQIYRIATERGWTLEVVNECDTSIVWDDPFASDRDADAAFRDTLAREGVQTFLDNDRDDPAADVTTSAVLAGPVRSTGPDPSCRTRKADVARSIDPSRKLPFVHLVP